MKVTDGTDAALSPYHVDRSKLFVMERFGGRLVVGSNIALDAEYALPVEGVILQWLSASNRTWASSDSEMPWANIDNLQDFLFNHEPPELPVELSPTQAAQLAEVVDYLRLRIRGLLNAVKLLLVWLPVILHKLFLNQHQSYLFAPQEKHPKPLY